MLAELFMCLGTFIIGIAIGKLLAMQYHEEQQEVKQLQTLIADYEELKKRIDKVT